MNTVVDEHQTTCSRCSGPFTYRLDVNDGGGFRYEVSCEPCDSVYYQVAAPPLHQHAADVAA